MLESLLRMIALTRKELLAILKDPRSRITLFVPPILQCLIFGYAATLDLSNAPYAALDQDRTAASHELLARLDGSGIFRRIANLDGPAAMARAIDDRRALLVVQIPQDFERRLQARRAGRRPGHRRRAQLQHRRRRPRLCQHHRRRLQRRLAGRPRPGRAQRAADAARLVQRQPGDPLEHDPGADRHPDHDADGDADGAVGGPRARTGHLRPAAGHPAAAGGDHRRQDRPVDDGRRGAGDQCAAGRPALVPHPVPGLVPGALRRAGAVPAGGGGAGPVRLVVRPDHAAGHALHLHGR